MKNNVKRKINSFDFCKNFYKFLIIPAVIIIATLFVFLFAGVNKGLEFKGGSVATIVVGEQYDFEKPNDFKNLKARVDSVLKSNNVCGEVYQETTTNYYGNAITIKFDVSKFNDEEIVILNSDLRNDLIAEFYPTLTDEEELKTFVKVETFAPSYSLETIVVSCLALLCALIAVAIYIFARYGFSSAMVAFTMCILDVLIVVCIQVLTRIKFEINFITTMAFVEFLSLLCSTLLISKSIENIRKDKYLKETNREIMNISVKQNLPRLVLLLSFMLTLTLLFGITPIIVVRRMSVPMLFGVLVCAFTNLLILPGLWSSVYIKRIKKAKEIKNENVEIVNQPAQEEKNITEEEKVIEEKELGE